MKNIKTKLIQKRTSNDTGNFSQNVKRRMQCLTSEITHSATVIIILVISDCISKTLHVSELAKKRQIVAII